MNNTDNILDPYDKPMYQAELVEQMNKNITFATSTDGGEKVKVQKQLEIILVNGGVKVIYNIDTFVFRTEDEKISFRREINAFFIRNNFFLDAIKENIPVFTLAEDMSTKGQEELSAYFYSCNSDLLSSEESEDLNKIITLAALRKYL